MSIAKLFVNLFFDALGTFYSFYFVLFSSFIYVHCLFVINVEKHLKIVRRCMQVTANYADG